MVITYPFDPPGDLPSAFRFQQADVVSRGVSPFTFKSQAQLFDGQQWVAVVSLPLLLPAKAAPWQGWLGALKGTWGTFRIFDPLHRAPLGSALGVPVVDGAAQAGEILNTRGWTINETGLLLAGDLFQLGDRLHQVLTSVDSDGSGDAAIDIWPRLRESPGDGAGLTLVDPKGRFRLAENARGWSESPPAFTTISFSCVEDL